MQLDFFPSILDQSNKTFGDLSWKGMKVIACVNILQPS